MKFAGVLAVCVNQNYTKECTSFSPQGPDQKTELHTRLVHHVDLLKHGLVPVLWPVNCL